MALKQLAKPKSIQWGAREKKEGSLLMLPHLYALTVSVAKSQTVLQPEWFWIPLILDTKTYFNARKTFVHP